MNHWVQGSSRQRYLGALQISTASQTQSSDTRLEKRELRRALRAQRRALPRWARLRAARHMAQLIMRQHWYRQARTLAAYIANDGEMDPAPLLRAAYKAGKRVLLPRLRGKRLEFVIYRGGAALRRNRFNIPEPVGAALAVERIDVVCVPLVGFDRHGRRLGMGGGFYDRTFAQRTPKNGRNSRGPRLIGLAYTNQQIARVPHENWDVRLEGVVTEREWIRACLSNVDDVSPTSH